MKPLFVSLIMLLLAACSSTPTTINYYLLDGAVNYSEDVVQTQSHKVVLLKKLELANYLHNANIPLLQDDHQVRYANNSAWAEPIQQGIKRALVNDFNHSSQTQLVLDSMPNSHNSDYQLQISIAHFSATDSGDVLLVGHYWLSQQDKVLTEQHFNFTQPLESDGFNQSIIQQRRLLKQLANMIVSDSTLKDDR